MGGKTGTSTASTSIPPEVLARYNAVNKQAQDTAAQPFQQYSTDPNAFVAPLNEEQQAATGQINQYANAAQPAISYAQQGFTPEGFQKGVQGYMNPFLQNAMGSTAAQMNNVNQQQQQKMMGSAIGAGAFGGDRANIGLGALENQQNLAMGQTLGQMANQGYQNAAQNYMTGLGQIGNLGIQGQMAGLQGAQAMMGAGTLGQQTRQAGLTALYNQFQQQQAYPFQVAQFLANIAEGTGALSGSTTTQTSPQSFFSDVRLKEDIKRVGTAHNGLPIYTFKYKGDDTEQTHIGYMAQDVEKVHPEAVGESHGFKTVDYDKASEPAHKYAGGVVGNSEGGAVMPHHMGEGFAVGGDVVSPTDLSALIAQQQQSYAPFQQAGIYGGQSGGTPHGGVAGVVPAGNLHVAKLQPAQISNTTEDDTFMGDVERAENIGDRLGKMKDYAAKVIGKPAKAATDTTAAEPATGAQGLYDWAKQYFPTGHAHGGVVGYAQGGSPYATDDPLSQVVSDTEKDANRSLMKSPIVNQKGNSTFGDLMSLAALPSEIAGMGSAASSIGSGIGSVITALAPIGLAKGGVVGYADGGDAGGLDGKMQYKIAPQELADMDPVQQQVVKGIYGPESGARYNVLNGGEQFDNTQAHPHRIGKGGQSTAAGAGQFIGSTWDSVTGGAPMTPGYQDAATYKLASDDYNRRTGRNLHEDVAQNGFSPEVKSALAPTWTSLGNAADRPAKGAVPAQAVVNGQQGFQAPDGEPQKSSPFKGIGDALTNNEHLIIPLLSGLGAMAGSKSRYLGSAILEGIGAGAGAYENVQNNIANRGLTNAQTSAQNVTAASDAQKMAQADTYKDANDVVNVYMPNGKTMSYGDWIKAGRPPTRSVAQATGVLGRIGAAPADTNEPADTTQPAAVPTTVPPVKPIEAGPTGVGNQGMGQINTDARQLYAMPESARTAQYAMSQKREAELNEQAESARSINNDNWYLAKRIMAQPDTGWNASGPNNSFRIEVATRLNDALGALGLPQWDTNNQDNSIVIEKLRTAAAAGQVSLAGQHSLESLMTMLQATPGAQMSKQAALQIIGRNIANAQLPLDQSNYLEDWKAKSEDAAGVPGMYLAHNAIKKFREDHPKGQYDNEQRSINAFFTGRDPQTGQTHYEQYLNGEVSPQDIEALYGKGFTRYLETH
jgi:muramidase (phage lysozyme)